MKRVLSVTIDKKILSKWKEYAQEECINSSKLIEKMLNEGALGFIQKPFKLSELSKIIYETLENNLQKGILK